MNRNLSYSEMKKQVRKPLEAWWTVLALDRFFINPLLYVVYRWLPFLTPNQITFISFVMCVVSAYAFYSTHSILGALLYQFYMILDCVDGRLARLTNQLSPIGDWFDGFVGHLAYLLNVTALVLTLTTEPATTILVLSLLLSLRCINCYMNECLPRPEKQTWSHFVPEEKSWLRQHRLLPPGSFPDKHAILFGVAPVLGYTLYGLLFIALLDILLIAMKSRKYIKWVYTRP